MKNNIFPFFIQTTILDYVPSCLKIISKYYGKEISINFLKKKFNNLSEGTSLKELSSVCEEIGLKNLALKIPYEDLVEKIPLPCIVELNSGHFVVLYEIENDKVYISDPKSGLITYNKEEFINLWTKNEDKGFLLAIETSEKFYEIEEVVQNNNNINKSLFSITLLFIILLVYKQFQIDFSIYQIISSILSFTGLFLSILILQENLGIINKINSKICGSSSLDVNTCQTILQDKGSYIYKNYTFSDLTLTFFTTISLLSVFSESNQFYFIAISILSIPIILYTIFYQMIKIKKWCRLCLSISLVLILIIITTFVTFKSINLVAVISSTIFFSLSFLFFILIWIILKPYIYGYFKFEKENIENKKFKNNFATFYSFLDTTSKINSNSLDNLQKIEIGLKTAKYEISLFLSPKCIYCYKTFKEAYDLYEKNKENIKLSIYLNVNLNNEKNNHRVVAEIIMQKYYDDGGIIALNLLREWFVNNVSLEEFTKRYNVSINEKSKETIISHFNWCNDNGFDYSPVKLFNKKVFPHEYEIEELNYFI